MRADNRTGGTDEQLKYALYLMEGKGQRRKAGGKAWVQSGISSICGKERGKMSLPGEQTPQILYNVLNLQSLSNNKPFN